MFIYLSKMCTQQTYMHGNTVKLINNDGDKKEKEKSK